MPHLLVVDGDRDVRNLLGVRARSFGHTVVTAGGAAAALRAASGDIALDLALLDVTPPGLHGFALLERLREHRPDLPAVVVTGARGLEQRAEDARAHLLRKPFPTVALRRVIELALVSSRPASAPAAPDGPAPLPAQGTGPAVPAAQVVDARPAAEVSYAMVAGRAALAMRRDLEALRRTRGLDGAS